MTLLSTKGACSKSSCSTAYQGTAKFVSLQSDGNASQAHLKKQDLTILIFDSDCDRGAYLNNFQCKMRVALSRAAQRDAGTPLVPDSVTCFDKYTQPGYVQPWCALICVAQTETKILLVFGSCI